MSKSIEPAPAQSSMAASTSSRSRRSFHMPNAGSAEASRPDTEAEAASGAAGSCRPPCRGAEKRHGFIPFERVHDIFHAPPQITDGGFIGPSSSRQ